MFSPPFAAENDSAAMFPRIASVLQHPRCLNCHTMTDFPRQGDDRHPHLFGVSRGPDDRGLPMGRCTSCHCSANNDATGVPGRGHLAPLNMAWEELSPGQLCQVLLDRKGNRSPLEIAHHIANDQQFVPWAWTPGRHAVEAERGTPPIPYFASSSGPAVTRVRRFVDSPAAPDGASGVSPH